MTPVEVALLDRPYWLLVKYDCPIVMYILSFSVKRSCFNRAREVRHVVIGHRSVMMDLRDFEPPSTVFSADKAHEQQRINSLDYHCCCKGFL